MSIALDTALTSGSAGVSQGELVSFGATTLTWSHNVGTDADRILMVHINIHRASSIATVTGITYAGVAMTKTDGAAANMTKQNSTNTKRVEIWKLVAPTTGANNIVVTMSAGGTFAIPMRVVGFGVSWTGVHQTTPLGTFASASGTSVTPSVDVTSATGEVVVDAVAVGSSTTLTAGSGQTARKVYSTIPADASATSSEAGAATVTMSWTSTSNPWTIGGVPLKPSVTTSPPVVPTADTVKISEISVHPLRNGAQGFSTLGTSSARLENQQAAWEASGMYAKVMRFIVRNGDYTWDDVYTLGSVAPAGRITISTLPTQQSPTGSLIVTTQDSIYQYPLPTPPEPSVVEYPVLAASNSTRGSDPIPIYYPSAWDGGDSVYTLKYVHVICKNVVMNTDTVQIMYRWDDTHQWENYSTTALGTRFRLSQNDCLFEIPPGNMGSVLRIAANINDGASTDPVAPKITGIICWVEELEHRDYPQGPDRAAVEVT